MTLDEIAARNLILNLEKILGEKVMAALLGNLQYTYFGTDDIAKVIQTKPELFERAMKELLGEAGLAILRISDTQRLLALR